MYLFSNFPTPSVVLERGGEGKFRRFWTVDRHPCKSKSRKKHEIPGRAWESAHSAHNRVRAPEGCDKPTYELLAKAGDPRRAQRPPELSLETTGENGLPDSGNSVTELRFAT